jgi:hypothetical protein
MIWASITQNTELVSISMSVLSSLWWEWLHAAAAGSEDSLGMRDEASLASE